MKPYLNENRCDAFARVKKGYGDLVFNKDPWGNEVIYRNGVIYRIDITYDTAICGIPIFIVKNGRGYLIFEKEDFDRYFVLIKKQG